MKPNILKKYTVCLFGLCTLAVNAYANSEPVKSGDLCDTYLSINELANNLETVPQVIYETTDPCQGHSWQTYDVTHEQMLGIRFQVQSEANYLLEDVSVWMMNHSATIKPLVKFTLRPNKWIKNENGDWISIPSEEVLETWTTKLQYNRVPELIQLNNNQNPVETKLLSEKYYWVVVEHVDTEYEFSLGWNKLSPLADDSKSSQPPYLALKNTYGGNESWGIMSGEGTSTVSIVVTGKALTTESN